MKPVVPWTILSYLILCITMFATRNALAQVPIAEPARLVVVARHDIKITGPSTAQYDFGVLSPFQLSSQDDLIFRHTFVLENISSRPIVVSRLKTPSPYTQAAVVQREVLYQEGVPVKLPVIVSPRAKVFIQTSVDTRALPPGSVKQTVLVYAEGQPMSVASLETSGILQSVINFSPPVADFGQVPLGRQAALTITMTLDPQFSSFGKPIPQKELPSMICTRRDVQVVTLPADLSKKNHLNNVMAFRLTLLPQTQVGEVAGELLLVPKPEMLGAGLLRKVSVPVSGIVVRSNAAH